MLIPVYAEVEAEFAEQMRIVPFNGHGQLNGYRFHIAKHFFGSVAEHPLESLLRRHQLAAILYVGGDAAFARFLGADSDYGPVIIPVLVHMEAEVDRTAIDLDEPNPLLHDIVAQRTAVPSLQHADEAGEVLEASSVFLPLTV